MNLKSDKRFWIVALVLVATSVGGNYLWYQPVREFNRMQRKLPVEKRLSAREAVEIVNAGRSTLISGIGTVATIFGGAVLFLNFGLATKKLDLDTTQVEINSRKIEGDKELAESRLISERFSKAVEQLSSESIHVRLGGIYSLEKIAQDSPDDIWTVMEVLTAFIREESPAHASCRPYDYEEPDNGFLPAEEDRRELKTVIQAAASVIARKPDDCVGLADAHIKFDLSMSDLSGVRWNGVQLQNADLSRGSLIDADLRSAVLEKTDFSSNIMCRADLQSANLQGANLRGVDLSYAQLQNADLRGADLKGANLTRANLNDADLSHTTLTGANLTLATLDNTKLVKSEMGGVKLMRARLVNTKMIGAMMAGSDLTETHIKGADLSEAILVSVNLDAATIMNTKMRKTNLLMANLKNIKLDSKVEGLKVHQITEQLKPALFLKTKLPDSIKIEPDRDHQEVVGIPISNNQSSR